LNPSASCGTWADQENQNIKATFSLHQLLTRLSGSVSVRANKYNWLDEGRDFQAASNMLRIVAVRRRKWILQ
jgi:hypothetical protein